ncbi:MAG: putative DNA binding domain-containing protein [Anaerolineae bacterium]|nr:putative DNA binding domain-containing protein [Anaerolineae bacterium]
MQWFLMDLHIHTPASSDYQEPGVQYLDILRKAEARKLDIIAFTDHNTVGGYKAMMDEIDKLNYLATLGRATPDEQALLAEYRRLLDSILVLPGFEFTATFGFHILGVFSAEKSIREIEHILLDLHIPSDALDRGNSNVGASSDVLSAYEAINAAGGIAIAAHANSNHGVAMRGFDFGGQTRIAYTQDFNLHSLEVTDLDRRGRGSTARFFDGRKPEYPRPMRCIQGSDAHRINADPRSGKHQNLGVGDRVTEVFLQEPTFEALLEMFQGNDLARTRPYAINREPYDFVQAARDEGPSIMQAFHEKATRRGGLLYAVVADVCAMANTNGGTIYVGVPADPKAEIVGLLGVSKTIEMIQLEIEQKLTPPLEVTIDAQQTQGKQIIRIQVPRGSDPPYAIDDNKIYVRDEADTSLAVRDEIVQLVVTKTEIAAPVPPPSPVAEPVAVVKAAPATPDQPPAAPDLDAPKTGVEIVGSEQRKGTLYHVMRDLRNGNIVKNVTRKSARRLWHYAITEKEKAPVDETKVEWHNDIGLWKRHKRGGSTRYDLVQRTPDGLRVYYGVTDDGMHGPWQAFIIEEDES